METIKQQYHIQITEDKPIPEKYFRDTIKRLKKEGLGPVEIPNEVFVEADAENYKIVLDVIKKGHSSEAIPASWLGGEIKWLYKGREPK